MSDGSGDGYANNATSNSTSSQQNSRDTAVDRLVQHFKNHKVDSVMWFLRVMTIFFIFAYLVPIFGYPQSAFNKTLMSHAAISALRLHQRLPAFTLSREFLGRLFNEDSCHYLMYSLMFFNMHPTFFVLLPILLFAVIHVSSYSLKLLDLIGQNSWCGARFIISLVEYQTTKILRAISMCEIFIMPLTIIMTIMGRAGLMTTIVYYNFLIMRYGSRRNPHTRFAFAELRMRAELIGSRSPSFIRKIIFSGIGFVNRLAPPQQMAGSQ